MKQAMQTGKNPRAAEGGTKTEPPATEPQDGRALELKKAAREILQEPETRAILYRIAELKRGKRLDL